MMVDWQVIAATIYCDTIDDDDVTIMVYSDRTTRCTGYKRYVENLTRETAKMLQQA